MCRRAYVPCPEPAPFAWENYGSGLFCLQAGRVAKPIAMVWREHRPGIAISRGILWGLPVQQICSVGKGSEQDAMDRIDRLRGARP